MDEQQDAQAPEVANDDSEARLSALTDRAVTLVDRLEVAIRELHEKGDVLRALSAQSTANAAEVERLLQQVATASGDATNNIARAAATAEESGGKIVEERQRLDAAVAEALTVAQTHLASLQTLLADANATTSQSTANARQVLDAANQSAAEQANHVRSLVEGASEQNTRIKQILTETESLKQEVLAHHTTTAEALASKERFEQEAAVKLQTFQAAADQAAKERQEFAQFVAETKDDISHLTKEAEAMLFGATNAGLSTAFNTEVTSLERQMRGAYAGFAVGILLLAASLVPLYLYMSGVQASHQLTPMDMAGGFFLRAAFIFPAAWLCYFCQRHAFDLFELRHQYVHKSTLSASVEPFRRQAGEHASAAVSGVLAEIMKTQSLR